MENCHFQTMMAPRLVQFGLYPALRLHGLNIISSWPPEAPEQSKNGVSESFLTSVTSDLQCCCIVDTSQGDDSVASRERERLQDWSNRLRVGVRMGQDVPKNHQLLAPRGPRAKCGPLTTL